MTVSGIVAHIFNLSGEEVVPELVIRELKAWDSLKHMELVVEIERQYDVELTFDEIVSIETVADILVVLSARGICGTER